MGLNLRRSGFLKGLPLPPARWWRWQLRLCFQEKGVGLPRISAQDTSVSPLGVSFYALMTYFISCGKIWRGDKHVWVDLVTVLEPPCQEGTLVPEETGHTPPALFQRLLPTPGTARAGGGGLALWAGLQTLRVVNTSIPPPPPPSPPRLICSFFQSTSVYGVNVLSVLNIFPVEV